MLNPELQQHIFESLPVVIPVIGASIVAFAKKSTTIERIETTQTGRIIKKAKHLENSTLHIVFIGDGAMVNLVIHQNGQERTIHVEDMNPKGEEHPAASMMIKVDDQKPQWINAGQTNVPVGVYGLEANAMLMDNGNSAGSLQAVMKTLQATEVAGGPT